jgi:hypothetical protein
LNTEPSALGFHPDLRFDTFASPSSLSLDQWLGLFRFSRLGISP